MLESVIFLVLGTICKFVVENGQNHFIALVFSVGKSNCKLFKKNSRDKFSESDTMTTVTSPPPDFGTTETLQWPTMNFGESIVNT